jgi:hypothetical protein
MPNVTMIESYFRWSNFDAKIDIAAFFGQDPEYQTPKEAETKHKIEDGEIAFDTGEPMYKLIFGIYSAPTMRRTFTADVFKKSHPNLVGCATILNWEWYQHYGSDEVDDFLSENVLEVLESEVEELTEHFVQHNYAPKTEEKVAVKSTATKKAAKGTKSPTTKKSATGSKNLFSPTKKAATKVTKAKSTAKRKAVRTKKLQKKKSKAKR